MVRTPPPPPPPEKLQKYRVFSNSGPGPLKIHKATDWVILSTPAKHHLNGVSLAGDDGPHIGEFEDPPTPHQLKKNIKKKNRQIWTPSDIIFCLRAWHINNAVKWPFSHDI